MYSHGNMFVFVPVVCWKYAKYPEVFAHKIPRRGALHHSIGFDQFGGEENDDYNSGDSHSLRVRMYRSK